MLAIVARLARESATFIVIRRLDIVFGVLEVMMMRRISNCASEIESVQVEVSASVVLVELCAARAMFKF
jgi:hypothetical protein